MVGRIVGVLFLTACSFELTPATGSIDASTDAPRCAGWMPAHLDACAVGDPAPALTLTAALAPYTYDTTVAGGVLTDRSGTIVMTSDVIAEQSNGPTLAVLNVEGFTLESGAPLFVIGSKPLVIAAWSQISIAGTIDAGSTTNEIDAVTHTDGPQRVGAGANPSALCATSNGASGTNAVSSGGSGGGGGGALSGNGGNGGVGDTTMQPGGPGGVAVSLPTVIRGGCKGGNSGTAGTGVSSPATAASFSAGGNGGGAIELAAREAIEIRGGTITAGGAGGAGAPQGAASGGGGGGSGGYVGLDAPSITIANSTVAANGGGGGGSAPFAGNGNHGANAASSLRAPGGAISGGSCGLAGAGGSAGTDRNGEMNPMNDSCGGGGGGGAAGYILVWAPTLDVTGALISPPHQSGS